jgi:methionyl-tRNA formyltransferase
VRLRLVVFAYHDIGYVCLEELLRTDDEVVAVITHADDPDEEVWFRSVRQLSEARGVPVYAPDDINRPEWIERVRSWEPDFLFSFYYRKLLGRDLLALPRRGALNLHGSLLPRYRGRCPVNWVLIHDEPETGVTLHYMEEKPDRGDMVAQRTVPITDADTALTLFRRLTQAAAALMHDTYPLLRTGQAPRLPQNHAAASYFGGRRPADGRIDWAARARATFNLVRAVTHPYPGAFTTWQGRTLYVWEAHPVPAPDTERTPLGTIVALQPQPRVQTGDGLIALERVQLEGDAERAGAEWAQRHGVQEGAQLL